MMKRVLILSLTLILAIVLSVFAVSAEATELIPADASWAKQDNGGASVAVEYKDDGSVVFSGSVAGTWPSVEAWYTDNPIAVNINEYSLVYDFTVESGNTNINFYFDSNLNFTICNTALGNVVYDTGSGDLSAGTYKGAIKLTDLIASTKLLNGEAFPQAAVKDDVLSFTGIQIYSVNGAVITVRAFDIVPNDEVPEESSHEESSETVSSEAESSEAVSSEAMSSEESSEAVPETESSVEATSSEATSAQTSSADAESSDAEEGPGNALMITIVAVVVIAAVIVVVVFLLKRKK